LALIVVFDASLALLLLLDERDVEVGVELAAVRGRPGKSPPHPALVRLNLREWCQRDAPQHHVVVCQVNREAVETVRDRRARCTARLVVEPEHVVIDKKLRAASKKVRQRAAPFVRLKTILFLDANPWQFLPLPRQLVAAPRVLLLRFEQVEPRA